MASKSALNQICKLFIVPLSVSTKMGFKQTDHNSRGEWTLYINNLAPKKWQEILCFIWWKNVRVFYNVVCNARQITTMHIVWNEKLSSREVNFLGLYLLLRTDLFSNLVSYWQSLSCKNPPWKLIYIIYVVTGMRFTKELITKVVNISSLIEWSSIKIYIRPFVFFF